MKTTRYWMQQRVKGSGVRYALHRKGSDVFGSEEAEFHAVDSGCHGLGRVHGGDTVQTAPTSAIWRY
jgi:hypothetical protein